MAADQITKIYVHANFQLGETVPVIQDIFHFTYVRNIGAAFGIFRDMPELFREVFFKSMPPIAMAIILYMLRSVENSDRWQVFALSSIFGGPLATTSIAYALATLLTSSIFTTKTFGPIPLSISLTRQSFAV